MIKASVIGWPISHSRSPLIHDHWLKQLGIEGSYQKYAVQPADLEHFLQGLRVGEHVGTNVTLPHKETALAFVDEPDDRVRRIGALNTIWRQAGKLRATSTDGPGFLANLTQTLPTLQVAAAPVTILGAGGSARAIIDELLRQGVDRINLINRTYHRAEALAQLFGSAVTALESRNLTAALGDTGLLINTTSAGLADQSEITVPWRHLKPGAAVTDIVYTPLVTPFLRAASTHDHPIVPGLGMLLHQAVMGFEKWFGQRPVVTQELHDLVARDIDPDYQP
jgi:shikimate dehydrogenase